MDEDHPQYNETVRRITAAVREADEGFEKTGGGSRHWVRDWFIPMLAKHRVSVRLMESAAVNGSAGHPKGSDDV